MASPSIPIPIFAEPGSIRQRAAVVGVLGAIALLWLLPFVWTEHRFPLAALDSELVAAASLGVALVCCGLAGRADASIGWRLPAFLSLLVALGYLHLALGWLTYPLQAHRLGIFVAAVLLAYLLGRQLIALGIAHEAIESLALAAIGGGTFSALIQWLQLFDLEWLPHQIALVVNDPQVRMRPFANIGQSNHMATYLGFGAFSALYWGGRAPRFAIGFGGALLMLASGLALTGSRMGTLYLVMVLASLFAPTALRPAAGRTRALFSLGMIAGYVVGVAVHRSMGADADTLARFGEGSFPIRFELWREALQVNLQHPLLGIGFGQFPAAQLWVAHTPYAQASTHCHNLFLQLATEFGWPVAIAGVGLMLWWFLGDLRSRLAAPHTALVLSMMMLIGIHSMLEYPLWHLYFAAPAALLFAIAEPERGFIAMGDARRVLAVSGLAVLGVVVALHNEFDAVAAAASPIWLDAHHVRAKTVEDSYGLLIVADSRLFRPEVERLLLELKHPPDEKTADPLRRGERVLRSLPAGEVISQRIVQLTKVGRIDEAVALTRRLPVFAGDFLAIYRDWILDQTRDLGPQTAPVRHTLREIR